MFYENARKTAKGGHYMRMHPTKGWQCWLWSNECWCRVDDGPNKNDEVLEYEDTKNEPEEN